MVEVIAADASLHCPGFPHATSRGPAGLTTLAAQDTYCVTLKTRAIPTGETSRPDFMAFVVWCGKWQWKIHLPGLSGLNVT